jgi:hypothetical protein
MERSMGWWGNLQFACVIACGVGFCTTAAAHPMARRDARIIEATYSTNEALSRSVAHIAVASTDIRPQGAQLSQADLFGLMIVLSLSKKHP